MTHPQFHNSLRILLNLDRDVLEQAGIIRAGEEGNRAWAEFSLDPFRTFIRASDEQARRFWALIEDRQPARRKDRP